MAYIDSIKSAIGQDITLRVVDDGDVNEWGDTVNETTTDKSMCAVVEPENNEVEDNIEGGSRNGSIRAFFDCQDGDVEEGNIIIYDGNEYRINEVNKYVLPGKGGHYEVRAGEV